MPHHAVESLNRYSRISDSKSKLGYPGLVTGEIQIADPIEQVWSGIATARSPSPHTAAHWSDRVVCAQNYMARHDIRLISDGLSFRELVEYRPMYNAEC